MKRKYYIQQRAWALFTWFVMRVNRNMQGEYNAYCYRCWESGLAALDDRQFLHRKLFPRAYDYEIACPAGCDGHLTSYGLCLECGTRWDVARTRKFGRPL